MAFSGPAEDRLAIRELYDTYADASWRGDRETWLACFAIDGRWTSHLFDCTGHGELAATWDGLWRDWQAVAFIGQIGAIAIEGDTARCRSYAREIVQLKSGAVLKLAGHYADALVRTDGLWRFGRRDYTMTIGEFPPEPAGG